MSGSTWPWSARASSRPHDRHPGRGADRLGHGPHPERVGRYRLWTLIGVHRCSCWHLVPVHAAGGVGRTYLVLWLLVMYLGNSILTLSHLSWASVLAPRLRRPIAIVRDHDRRRRARAATATRRFRLQRYARRRRRLQCPFHGLVRLPRRRPIADGLMFWRTPERRDPEVAGVQFRLRDYSRLLDPALLRPAAAGRYLRFARAGLDERRSTCSSSPTAEASPPARPASCWGLHPGGILRRTDRWAGWRRASPSTAH